MSPTEQRLFSASQIAKAGSILRDTSSTPDKVEWAAQELNRFRWQHVEPLNVLQNTLRTRLKKLGLSDAIVAQRIKRKPTILEKLQRFRSMRLDQMDDIGGIRAIVGSIAELQELRKLYTEGAHKLLHELQREDDYIASPKVSGYRGVHLVFRYQTNKEDKAGYNGLRIEMQLRTQLQHTWATAVETFEAFMGEKFKSSQGAQEWLDFFALVASAFALKEKQVPLPAHAELTKQELASRIKQQANNLQVGLMMKSFSLAANNLAPRYRQKGGLALMIFDSVTKSANVTVYPKDKYELAYEAYIREEQRSSRESTRQVVLVKMDSIQKLEKAYPNYFARLKDFQTELNHIFSWSA